MDCGREQATVLLREGQEGLVSLPPLYKDLGSTSPSLLTGSESKVLPHSSFHYPLSTRKG